MKIDENRIYGTSVDICGEDVQDFYNQRARKTGSALTSVNLNQDADISRRRDEKEKGLIVPLLDLKGSEKVLEIGCGLGRFVSALESHVADYVGIDFSEELIQIAQRQFCEKEHLHFQVMSATDIQVGLLPISPPYDLFMSMGLMVYLNDKEVVRLLETMADLASPAAKIYIRESVSVMDERLTLKDFPSQELDASYNAVYRTVGEYMNYFEDVLFPKGFKLTASDLFLDDSLGAREETNQNYFLLERVG